MKMKRTLLLVLISLTTLSLAEDLRPSGGSDVIHVATALDHLTVLEFGEPVVMAAAGSGAFQIERQENKVFVKPLKPGVSTDLFVWTASRRFAYELEPAGEVKNMNFAIDSPAPAPKLIPDSHEQMTKVADMLLTKALLGAERIDSSGIKDAKDRITVRVEQVFESSNTLYIHYSISNLTSQPYRVLAPTIHQLLPSAPAVSLPSFAHSQLSERMVRKLGQTRRIMLPVANAEIERGDLAPGQHTRGVIAIRQQFNGPTVFELVFADRGDHHVTAIFVR
jgi:Conjugal transfer protein